MASMGIHLQVSSPSSSSSAASLPSFKLAAASTTLSSFQYQPQLDWRLRRRRGDDGQRRQLKKRSSFSVAATAASDGSNGLDGFWKPRSAGPEPPGKAGALSPSPSFSDVLWPSAGAFAAMALLGRLDQVLAPKGLSFTIAPLGAVCAVLFIMPNSPAAKKRNVFAAHVACAAFGVLALSVFGPGWLARSISLAASVAFMVSTGTTHPPAAGLPILFIDGAKFHQLHFWYLLFPGAAGCVLLCLIQEMVLFLKSNLKF